MINNNVTSNITITALQQYLLTAWKTYGLFWTAATKTVPLSLHTVSVLANTTLIIYLIRSRRCRLPIFALLTSLAMCDWLSSFTSIVMVLLCVPNIQHVAGAQELCHVAAYLGMLAFETSICHLMALAALRFFQLVYPLQAKAHVTTGRVLKCCCGTWLVCTALAVLNAVNNAVTAVPYNDKTLLIWHFIGNYAAKEICLSIFAQGIPLLSIVLLHLIKLFKVTKASQISESERRSSSSRTVTLLIICFVLSILPRFLHMCYHSVLRYPYRPIHAGLDLYTGMVQVTNSALNPFLYLLSSPEIREDIYKMEQCKAMKKI